MNDRSLETPKSSRARAGVALAARSGATLLLCALTGACIMPDQFSKIQKDVADVRQQLQRIENEQATALRQMEDIARRNATAEDRVSAQDLADLSFRMDQATREAASANQRLTDLSQRFERLSQEVARRRDDGDASRSSGTPPAAATDYATTRPANAAAARGSGSASDELYNTAYADFSKGNYDLAIAGFEDFHETYPDHSQADNALYWVGECHFSQGDFGRAIQAFDRLLELYPDSDKAPSGDLKKGLAFLEQNQVSQAIVQFQHVRNTYGGTDEARVARERLSALGITS